MDAVSARITSPSLGAGSVDFEASVATRCRGGLGRRRRRRLRRCATRRHAGARVWNTHRSWLARRIAIGSGQPHLLAAGTAGEDVLAIDAQLAQLLGATTPLQLADQRSERQTQQARPRIGRVCSGCRRDPWLWRAALATGQQRCGHHRQHIRGQVPQPLERIVERPGGGLKLLLRGALQFSPLSLHIDDNRPAERYADQIRFTQVNVAQDRVGEIGAEQIGAAQIDIAQHGPSQVDVVEHRAALTAVGKAAVQQQRLSQVGVVQIGLGEVAAHHDRATEVGVGQRGLDKTAVETARSWPMQLLPLGMGNLAVVQFGPLEAGAAQQHAAPRPPVRQPTVCLQSDQLGACHPHVVQAHLLGLHRRQVDSADFAAVEVSGLKGRAQLMDVGKGSQVAHGRKPTPAHDGRKRDSAHHEDVADRGQLWHTLRVVAAVPPEMAVAGSPIGDSTGRGAARAGAEALVGAILDGDFELVELVGQGSHGEVYAARQRSVGQRRVAVKVLSTLYGSLPEGDVRRAAQAMQREAELLGSLRSACFVAVYRTGLTADKRPYFAMEWAEGQTIAQLLRRDQRVTRRVVADIVQQWAAGLGELHDRGFVHRDVAPGNCVVSLVGTRETAASVAVKSYDLGTASQIHGTADRFRVGWERERPQGTPAFMAPEQAQGGVVDGRADQFALAAIVYELLSGQRVVPTSSQRAADVLEYLRGDHDLPHRPLDTLRSDLGGDVVEAVHRALRRDPQQRFADIRIFASIAADALRTGGGAAADVPAPWGWIRKLWGGREG